VIAIFSLITGLLAHFTSSKKAPWSGGGFAMTSEDSSAPNLKSMEGHYLSAKEDEGHQPSIPTQKLSVSRPITSPKWTVGYSGISVNIAEGERYVYHI
jgi:hypothetical protein